MATAYQLIQEADIQLTKWYAAQKEAEKESTYVDNALQICNPFSYALPQQPPSEQEMFYQRIEETFKKTLRADPFLSKMLLRNGPAWADVCEKYEEENPPEVKVIEQVAEVAPAAEVQKNTVCSVRVGNLPPTITRQDLEFEFVPFGNIKDIHIPLDRVTKKPRGFGFIEFKSADSAINALTLAGKLYISSRPIKIELAQAQRKTSEEMARMTKTVD